MYQQRCFAAQKNNRIGNGLWTSGTGKRSRDRKAYRREWALWLGRGDPLPKFTGETPEFVQYVLEKELISEIIGVDAADLWEARNRWNHKLPEHAAAKMALEAAFYDLAAKERKLPL